MIIPTQITNKSRVYKELRAREESIYLESILEDNQIESLIREEVAQEALEVQVPDSVLSLNTVVSVVSEVGIMVLKITLAQQEEARYQRLVHTSTAQASVEASALQDRQVSTVLWVVEAFQSIQLQEVSVEALASSTLLVVAVITMTTKTDSELIYFYII